VVGNFVGLEVGKIEGVPLGDGDGIADGLKEGTGVVGSSVGLGDGITDGFDVGTIVVGNFVGLGVGNTEGV